MLYIYYIYNIYTTSYKTDTVVTLYDPEHDLKFS